MKGSSYRSLVRPSNRIIVLFLILCISLCSTGCAFGGDGTESGAGRKIEPIPVGPVLQDAPGHDRKPQDEQVSDVPSDDPDYDFPDSYSGEAKDEDGYEVAGSEGSLEVTGIDGYTDEEINAAAAENVGRFAYERLDKIGKRVYNEIYLTLRDMHEMYEIDCRDVDEINRLFRCVMMDHPEIFWVSGFVYTKFMRGDVLEAMGFNGVFTMDAVEIASRQAAIDAYVDTCLAGVPESDDYGKIKYIYEYLIRNTDYDTSAVDNQNICSVFINGRSVCQGYAKATQYLLNRLRIPCTLVTGTVVDQGNHAWNLLFADGSYYYLDTTWGDANYRYEEGLEGSYPSINYDYLCVPDFEILQTHTPDTPVDLPQCMALNDNYYVREGAYFTAVDEAKIQQLFDRAREQGRDFVTVKASDTNVYADLKHYLLVDEMVFSLVGGGEKRNSVSYWENDKLYTLSFSL